MRASDITGGLATAGLVEELSVVTLVKAVETTQGVVPAGASGTVVHVHAGRIAYIVEFYEPFHAVATVEADAIAASRAAENPVCDRVMLSVTVAAFDAFRARLDAPPRQNDKLRRALLSSPPWVA